MVENIFDLDDKMCLGLDSYHARWEKWESVEQAMREQPKASNSAILCFVFPSSWASYIPEPVIEGNDLCGTDKGEVEGVEEEHHVLARVVGEADLRKIYTVKTLKSPS